MSRLAAGVLAMMPGVGLGVVLVLNGMPPEAAFLVGGGLGCIGFDVCMRVRRA